MTGLSLKQIRKVQKRKIGSISGFIGYMGTVPVHYEIMGAFAAVTVVSSLTGAHFAKRLHADTLKKAFAWSLVIAATYIFAKSVI